MSPSVSFEFFPPRSAAAEQQLWSVIDRLAPLAPSFVSVTYGAGGSTRDATLETLRTISGQTTLRAAGHLTCVGRSREDVDATIRDYWDAGVRHIVALRGDMPTLGEPFVPAPEGYAGSPELVSAIRRIAPFEVSVSAYPEVHPESRSLAADLELLARKVDAGATRAITQFCFLTERVARFRDRVDRAGINVPIVPGIMPATNFAAVSRMARLCGATVPNSLAQRFDGLDDDPQTRALIAAIITARQIEELRCEGFEEFHFYTLNQADVVTAVCRLHDLGPAALERQAA
jgi:methylenetetrahydrofolate reductase (NADPH)